MRNPALIGTCIMHTLPARTHAGHQLFLRSASQLDPRPTKEPSSDGCTLHQTAQGCPDLSSAVGRHVVHAGQQTVARAV
jgi:hypothetical protein